MARLCRVGGGAAFHRQVDYRNSRALNVLERFVPFTEETGDDRFLLKKAGKRYATPPFAALIVVEASDLLFAVDSVPAVLSITSSTFVAYSAVAFAILGLRSLYFALEGLIDRFAYLNYGLAAILVFVGAKFVLEGFGVHLPILASLLPIAAIIAVSIAASVIAARHNGAGPTGTEDERGSE